MHLSNRLYQLMNNRFSQESQVVMEQVIRSRLYRHIYMTTFVQLFFGNGEPNTFLIFLFLNQNMCCGNSKEPSK